MRRLGRWQYDATTGWRLDGTDLVLDYDRLDGGGGLRGAYVLYRRSSDGTGEQLDVVDHYLDGAMAYVEENLAEYANSQESPS